MTNLDKLTIGEAKERLIAAQKDVADISALFGITEVTTSEMKYPIGQKVIIRAHDAGVHFGELVSVDGRSVVLKDARRMWRWWSGGGETTLNGVARHGLDERKELGIAGVVSEIVILDACEIILASHSAITSIESAKVAKATT